MKVLPVKWSTRLITAGALATAIVTLAAALRPVIRPVWRDSIVSIADSIYVRIDSAQLQRLRDSVTKVLQRDPQLAKMDSILRCVKTRHPHWCEK